VTRSIWRQCVHYPRISLIKTGCRSIRYQSVARSRSSATSRDKATATSTRMATRHAHCRHADQCPMNWLTPVSCVIDCSLDEWMQMKLQEQQQQQQPRGPVSRSMYKSCSRLNLITYSHQLREQLAAHCRLYM